MAVQFKVTLTKGKEEETKRFFLDSPSYSSLLTKLVTLWPSLQEGANLAWVDQEGDRVNVGGEDDISLALQEQDGALKRFLVQPTSTENDLHCGVTCDACEGPVQGRRYKCMECIDFDLCQHCEAKGEHSKHKMVRVSKPALPRTPVFFLPLAPHQLSTEVCKNTRQCKKEQKVEQKKKEEEDKQETTDNEEEEKKKKSDDSPLGEITKLITAVAGPALAQGVEPFLQEFLQELQKNVGTMEEKVNLKEECSKSEEQIAKEKKKTAAPVVEAENEKPNDSETTEGEFEVVNVSPRESVYPTLEKEDQARLWKTSLEVEEEKKEEKIEEEKKESDPTIAMALAAMKELGYNDDEGWLSALLKSKQAGKKN